MNAEIQRSESYILVRSDCLFHSVIQEVFNESKRWFIEWVFALEIFGSILIIYNCMVLKTQTL